VGLVYDKTGQVERNKCTEGRDLRGFRYRERERKYSDIVWGEPVTITVIAPVSHSG
jgi:hypothetical protein